MQFVHNVGTRYLNRCACSLKGSDVALVGWTEEIILYHQIIVAAALIMIMVVGIPIAIGSDG